MCFPFSHKWYKIELLLVHHSLNQSCSAVLLHPPTASSPSFDKNLNHKAPPNYQKQKAKQKTKTQHTSDSNNLFGRRVQDLNPMESDPNVPAYLSCFNSPKMFQLKGYKPYKAHSEQKIMPAVWPVGAGPEKENESHREYLTRVSRHPILNSVWSTYKGPSLLVPNKMSTSNSMLLQVVSISLEYNFKQTLFEFGFVLRKHSDVETFDSTKH